MKPNTSYGEKRHSYLIGHRFKKDGCSRDFLLVCHEAMGQVASIGQVQTHDAPVGFHQGGVHCEVGRGAWTGQARGDTIASVHEAPSRTASLGTKPSTRCGQNRPGRHYAFPQPPGDPLHQSPWGEARGMFRDRALPGQAQLRAKGDGETHTWRV